MTGPKKFELAWRKRDLTEKRIKGEWVYRGKLLRVRRDSVRLPDGRQTEREYIEHPGAVMVIPVFEDGELVMERQFRYPLRRDMLELPAGKIDPGEPPLECAKRELLEETGYSASAWRFVATIHPVIGYSSERIEIFLAQGLAHHGAKPDDGENIEIFKLPIATALEWVREGRITDAKTVAGLFWAERILSGEWSV
ncbi:MAG: NUDIX hydrolase [Betaproteobacteria bacterium]|nr:NUDIX hydrolase [Betaproteobacteria bacterium]